MKNFLSNPIFSNIIANWIRTSFHIYRYIHRYNTLWSRYVYAKTLQLNYRQSMLSIVPLNVTCLLTSFLSKPFETSILSTFYFLEFHFSIKTLTPRETVILYEVTSNLKIDISFYRATKCSWHFAHICTRWTQNYSVFIWNFRSAISKVLVCGIWNVDFVTYSVIIEVYIKVYFGMFGRMQKLYLKLEN